MTGPSKFYLREKSYKRTDFQLTNKSGLVLECSHFEPTNPPTKRLPCVIYLHGNSSSRIEGIPAAEILLPLNITVFCFDFTGCGHSEGDYISLGWYERSDVETAIEYLRSTNKVSKIGIWGRSMGAVTALLYAEKDPTIAGLVLDSPFANLRLLIDEIAKKHTKIPKFIVNGAMTLVRKTILAKAKFDINKLIPIEHVGMTVIPALFVAGIEDNFIEPHHTRDIFEKYRGKKNLMLVEGNHNSARPAHLLESTAAFFQAMLFANKETSEDYNFLNTLSDNVNDYIEQEEGDCLQFVKRKPNLFGVGANEDQICANLKIGFYEDELRKALEESMRMAQENVLERDITYYTENHQSPSNEILEKRNLTEGSDSFRFEKELFGFNGKNRKTIDSSK